MQSVIPNFSVAADYVRQTLHLNDMRVHSIAVSADLDGCVEIDFDYTPDAAGALDRLSGRMTVWIEPDGQLYGEW